MSRKRISPGSGSIDLIPAPCRCTVGGDGDQIELFFLLIGWGHAGSVAEDCVDLSLKGSIVTSGKSFESLEYVRLDISDMERFHTGIMMRPLTGNKSHTIAASLNRSGWSGS